MVNAIPQQNTRSAEIDTHYDAIIIGAGFAGMYMLHCLRELGLSVRVYEAGWGVGGTWYGRIPIFWVNRRLTPEVNLPCFSAYSTVRLCNTPEALTSPRHFLDTKRCSALSTAG